MGIWAIRQYPDDELHAAVQRCRGPRDMKPKARRPSERPRTIKKGFMV